MDALLKQLAEASMAVGEAEEALEEGANTAARDRLEDAATTLAELRGGWPRFSAAERTLVGKTAAPLKARLDAAQARLPKLSALSQAPAEADPEDEQEPH